MHVKQKGFWKYHFIELLFHSSPVYLVASSTKGPETVHVPFGITRRAVAVFPPSHLSLTVLIVAFVTSPSPRQQSSLQHWPREPIMQSKIMLIAFYRESSSLTSSSSRPSSRPRRQKQRIFKDPHVLFACSEPYIRCGQVLVRSVESTISTSSWREYNLQSDKCTISARDFFESAQDIVPCEHSRLITHSITSPHSLFESFSNAMEQCPELSTSALNVEDTDKHFVYRNWPTEMADVNPVRVKDVTDGLIVIYTTENHICHVSHTYAVSGLNTLRDFNKIGEELRAAVISSLLLRLRLAAFELSPNFEADIKRLEPVVRAFRHLCKDPSRMYSEMWRGCSIVCFVDIIYKKAIMDALGNIPLEYRDTYVDDESDFDMPDLVDPEEFFEAARANAVESIDSSPSPN
ncbi:hypothetical protein SCHPADRAFT_894873 [Schizopora paradoxa]|uniref:Uncharacterized protein n=1 Tax=Schizopora paradoxa TaxID=27342 RepID=A0A0H2R5U5_9AGAM|nr:hypothetical protein SCHPADRAFT_894873 [Schizopora paradoxa]